ncbi:MAG TPA: cytochrome c4, partial [Nannocystis exedens]|nr:cytochrome c4 [Nannocystis exedens]
MKLVPLALTITALLGGSVALAADDATSEGAKLAFEGANGIAACSSCHALNGWGNLQAKGPALAGQNPGYIRHQLRSYREGTRVHESMDPVAKLITDSQIVSVSEHYAAMPAGRATQEPPKPEDAKIGQRLATRGAWDREIPACEQCHGPGGRGAGEHFPRLAGQHAFYLKGQLEAWRSGVRKNDPNELMKGIA